MSKPLHNLRSFLDLLKKENQLRVIDAAVDPCLELAEIQRRVVARQGAALLFTNVKDSKFPVVTNLFGTPRRIELAFGAEPTLFFRQVLEALEILHDPSPLSLWKSRGMALSLTHIGTSVKPSGPAIEYDVSPPCLSALPRIKSWPLDSGAFLTLPLVYSEHPVTGRSNIGMYRGQIFDDSTLGMHFQIHRGIGFHYYEAEKRNEPLPVNVFLGGPPALILSAIAPLPENIPEAIFASLLLGAKIDFVRDHGISPLPLAAESEFTFVG